MERQAIKRRDGFLLTSQCFGTSKAKIDLQGLMSEGQSSKTISIGWSSLATEISGDRPNYGRMRRARETFLTGLAYVLWFKHCVAPVKC